MNKRSYILTFPKLLNEIGKPNTLSDLLAEFVGVSPDAGIIDPYSPDTLEVDKPVSTIKEYVVSLLTDNPDHIYVLSTMPCYFKYSMEQFVSNGHTTYNLVYFIDPLFDPIEVYLTSVQALNKVETDETVDLFLQTFV